MIIYAAKNPPTQQDFSFDPTYGYNKEALLAVTHPKAPAGFTTFWKETFEEFQKQEIKYEIIKVDGGNENWDVFQVFYTAWDGVKTGAWIKCPKDRPVTSGVVLGHGYGGREEFEVAGVVEDAVYIFPISRGFNISENKSIPSNDADKHVIHGIESKENYVLRGCVVEHWYATSILQKLYPEIEDSIFYMGSSFGGGIGALMLPWDKRFKKAFLGVPTFGNHPIRLQSECQGSGESVRRYYKSHPEVVNVLSYYDAAIAASFIKIPMLVAPALFDPAVPPPGQFAVCNSLAGEKSYFIYKAGHFEYSESIQEESMLIRHQKKFFNRS